MKRYLYFSEQDLNVDFQPSDFQDETDSTVVVRERTKGSNLDSAFAKKSGKIVAETTHTIAMLPEASKREKLLSKRDVVKATTEQKKKFKNSIKGRVFLSESSSSR